MCALGIVTTLAGSTISGNKDGFGTNVGFAAWRLTLSLSTIAGVLYIADSDNNKIRTLDTGGQHICLSSTCHCLNWFWV